MKKLKKKILRKTLRIAIDAINYYDIDTYSTACILHRHNMDFGIMANGDPFIIYLNNKRKTIKEIKI